MVSIAHLEPSPHGKDPFNRVQNEKPPPVCGTTDEYEIERIVDKRLRNVRGKNITEYLLRWKGYGAEDDMWYRLEDLDKAKELVDVYERQYGLRKNTRSRRKAKI